MNEKLTLFHDEKTVLKRTAHVLEQFKDEDIALKTEYERLAYEYNKLFNRTKLITTLCNQSSIPDQEFNELKKAYEKFIPREFLNLLNKNSLIEINLGDKVEKEMTILVSDIRGFTSLSENMTLEDNFDFINAYLSRMEPLVGQHRGFVDKYIGDAIMALFPSANDAIQAAIGMLEILGEYNLTRGRPGRPCLNIGIGIHTGDLILGTVGGPNRMEGTVISNAVNFAHQMETMTKMYGAALLISEHSYASLPKPSKYTIRTIDRVKVKGKSSLVTIYEIIDGNTFSIIELKKQTLDNFEQGLAYYCDKQFDQAMLYFKRVLQVHAEDKAAQIYLKRCKYFLSNKENPTRINETLNCLFFP